MRALLGITSILAVSLIATSPGRGLAQTTTTDTTTRLTIGTWLPAENRFLDKRFVTENRCTATQCVPGYYGPVCYCTARGNVTWMSGYWLEMADGSKPLPYTSCYTVHSETTCVDGYYGKICYADPHDTTVCDNVDLGCGRKAAQNALHYLGVDLSQYDIAGAVSATEFTITGERLIATWPDDLRNGLQRLLDRYGHQRFTVRRISGVSLPDQTIQSIITGTGLPVIALVDGGSHWVVVDGFVPNLGYHVLDNGSETYRSRIDLSFGTGAGLYSGLTSNSYEEGTLVYFEGTSVFP